MSGSTLNNNFLIFLFFSLNWFFLYIICIINNTPKIIQLIEKETF